MAVTWRAVIGEQVAVEYSDRLVYAVEHPIIRQPDNKTQLIKDSKGFEDGKKITDSILRENRKSCGPACPDDLQARLAESAIVTCADDEMIPRRPAPSHFALYIT